MGIGLRRGRGEKCLAQLHLTFARLPPLTADQAFALFAADELLKDGLSPHALMKGLGFDPAPLDALEKYNPDQPRVPAGNGRASGQWGSGSGGALVGGSVSAPSPIGHGVTPSDISAEPAEPTMQVTQADEQPPPLRRIHPDATYESDQKAKGSLEYWRTQPTEKIIPSLRPGLKDSLKVKPDGSIMDGNTRVKVLEERGINAGTLPREPYGLGFSIGGQLNEPEIGGGGGPVRRLPLEE